MPSFLSDPPDDATATAAKSLPPAAVVPAEDARREGFNFGVMALHQILLRMGWIFKTESIVMPAVLDSINGSGWLRGCLPMLNRFGQSVPPLLAVQPLTRMRRKKWALAGATGLMAGSFLGLSAVWLATGGTNRGWLPVVFLALYAVFFMSMGVNQLAIGTLQGKLIPTERRGRLLVTANVLGGVVAITGALCLLPYWLRADGGDFGVIFGFTGVCFAVSAVGSLLLVEHSDSHVPAASGIIETIGEAMQTLRDDTNFRRLAIVGALFGSSIMLFPHYQALGLERLHLTLDKLILWVVVQNVGTVVFSFPAGLLADRFGNRLVLCLEMLVIAVAPPLAVILSYAGPAGGWLYYVVFLLIGLTAVTNKTLNNYALEICEPADHPQYLGTLNLCVALPIFLSPLVGLLVDFIGFDAVFLGVACVVVAGWLGTFGLREPRHRRADTLVMLPAADE